MDEEIAEKIKAQDEKIDEILTNVKKTRRYFLWSFWLTIAFFVLPLIALVFVIPWFLNTYLGSLGVGGGSGDTQELFESVKMLQDLL